MNAAQAAVTSKMRDSRAVRLKRVGKANRLKRVGFANRLKRVGKANRLKRVGKANRLKRRSGLTCRRCPLPRSDSDLHACSPSPFSHALSIRSTKDFAYLVLANVEMVSDFLLTSSLTNA